MALLQVLKRLTVRDVIALFLVAIAAIFLLIDSNILARGAARWADSAFDRFCYGLVAFLVPWVVAVTPFVVIILWRQRHRAWALVSCLLWCVFVAYNLIGAGGAIAMIRADVISVRTQEVNVHSADLDTRSSLQRQRDDIPKGTRQPGQIEALIEKEKASPWWQYSSQCRNASNPRERKFCGGVAALQGELSAAKALAVLNDKIAALDARVRGAGPVATMVDPAATFVAGWSGMTEKQAQAYLPLATPIVLMLGSIFILAIAMAMADTSHAAIAGAALGQQRSGASVERGKPLHVVSTAVNVASITSRQRDIARWFFRDCVRLLASGELEEAVWFQHYASFCKASNDEPMSLTQFHAMARQHIPEMRTDRDSGVTWYLGALPLIPTKVARA